MQRSGRGTGRMQHGQYRVLLRRPLSLRLFWLGNLSKGRGKTSGPLSKPRGGASFAVRVPPFTRYAAITLARRLDLADRATLHNLADGLNLDAAPLLTAATTPKIRAVYAQNTAEAISRSVFAPPPISWKRTCFTVKTIWNSSPAPLKSRSQATGLKRSGSRSFQGSPDAPI